MLLRPLTRREVRELDRIAVDRFGMSGLVLMENAGREAAREIAVRFPAGTICILCGKGNNAGDGYVIARHLQLARRSQQDQDAGAVRIVSLVDPAELSGDAAANHAIAAAGAIPIAVLTQSDQLREAIGSPDVIVDCLLGTGASGNPREPLAEAIRVANALPAARVAIDLPSGLDSDSGVLGEPTFRADVTLTMVAAKVGFSAPAAQQVLGEVRAISIGVPLRLLSEYC